MTPDVLRRDEENRDIAIISMACRLPGKCSSPQAFWDFLMSGGDGIIDIPQDRWDAEKYFDPDQNAPNKMHVKRGGFIEAIDQFDPQFFGIAPIEAPHIDPQHRWLLELSYELFENAGLKTSDFKGSDTAVYIGQFMHDYEQIQLDHLAQSNITPFSATGPSMTLTANRISYSFDFTGPSVTLDTACSSSLVALDMACKAILNGDSRLALAGGVNILLRPELTISICKASMLSPDMKCKSFDASANGYVRSEGAGLVLLKRLSDAMRDGDPILAVIKATSVNQDGHTNGITVPNGLAQQKLLQKSLAKARIDSSEIHYVEAHGTGTAVGDPIEVNALGAILRQRDARVAPCIIGSVKSNIGHTEATAGIAALIKTVLAMNHGVIPKNLHLTQVNPSIDLQNLHVRLATEHTPWPDTQGKTRKAAVNSFGFGGTNANVVLEQSPAAFSTNNEHATELTGRYLCLPLSGKTESALRANAEHYLAYLQGTNHKLSDIVFSASARRDHFRYRAAFSGKTKAQMQLGLEAFIAGKPSAHFIQGRVASDLRGLRCFVFSGMGTTWATMARELYNSEPVFRDEMDRCDTALRQHASWSLLDMMWQQNDAEKIHATYIAQPAIFSTQVALAALLAHWGIKPDCIVGHSAGEVAAAYVAGALDFEDAIKVIYHRSRLQHTTEGTGKMLAVALTELALQPWLQGHENQISIAAINSEDSLTLSGDAAILNALAEQLEVEGIFARFLNVDVPYHSPMMDQLKRPLIEALQFIKVQTPHTPLYSTVSGELSRVGDWGAHYWPENVRAPVKFKQAIDNIAASGCDIFIEVAPHAALASAIKKNIALVQPSAQVITTMRRDQNDALMLNQTMAALHVIGMPIDWSRLNAPDAAFVTLPNYAWQRSRYWHEIKALEQARLNNTQTRSGFFEETHPLLGGQLKSQACIWQTQVDLQQLPLLADHQLEGDIIYPGAAYVEMGLSLGKSAGLHSLTLEDIRFHRALFLDNNSALTMETILDRHTGQYQISALDEQHQAWELFSSGTLHEREITSTPEDVSLAELKEILSVHIDKSSFYQHCHKIGLTYLTRFQAVEQIWHNTMDVLVELRLPASEAGQHKHYALHPSLLDGAFQGLFATVREGYLPVRIGRCDFYQQPSERCYAHLRMREKNADMIHGDIYIINHQGVVMVAMHDVEVKSSKTQATFTQSSLLYDYHWQAQPLNHNTSTSTDTNTDTSTDTSTGPWLIFADRKGIGKILAAALEARAHSVIFIEEGPRFEQIAEKYFVLPLDHPEPVLSLLNQFAATSVGIIYLWALDSQGHDCRHSTISPLIFAQALDQVNWLQQQRLFFITQGAHRVEHENIQPAQACLWGFGRVFANEHPEYSLHLLDLDPTLSDGLVHQLVDEMHNNIYEQEIALRQSGRFVHRLRQLQLPHSQPAVERHAQANHGELDQSGLAPLIRSDRSYLVTGGLGGLGLEMMQWLADQGASSIVLLGRNPGSARALPQIEQLRNSGVQITIMQADVSIEADVKRIMASIATALPPLAGIIHSAGVLEDATVMRQTPEMFEKVLAPKVAGSWFLHQHSGEFTLDFFILFSSIAAVVGWPGQSNYAAANAFMDSLAQHRRASGLAALSINWGPWSHAGMAANLNEHDRLRMQEAGMNSLTPAQGLQAMTQCLNHRVVQAGIFDVDWNLMTNVYPEPGRLTVFSDFIGLHQHLQKTNLLDELLALAPPERAIKLAKEIAITLAEVLSFNDPDAIDPKVTVFEYGLNSLMGMDFKNRLQSKLHTKLPTTLALKYPTIQAMVQFIMESQLMLSSDENLPNASPADDESRITLVL